MTNIAILATVTVALQTNVFDTETLWHIDKGVNSKTVTTTVDKVTELRFDWHGEQVIVHRERQWEKVEKFSRAWMLESTEVRAEFKDATNGLSWGWITLGSTTNVINTATNAATNYVGDLAPNTNLFKNLVPNGDGTYSYK